MNTYTLLSGEAGGAKLTADQLAQVRALDVGYQTALFRLRHVQDEEPGHVARRIAALEAALRADVLAVLTPEQRRHAGAVEGATSGGEAL